MLHRSLLAILVSCTLAAACARRTPEAVATPHDRLAATLAGWERVRSRAERNLLTVPLPSIAVRGAPTDALQPTWSVVPRLSPHFAVVQMAWPAICERRGVLPDDVFQYAMAWCRHAEGRGAVQLERALVGALASAVPGLRAAALADLVDVLADGHDAAAALRVLDHVGATPGMLARLAAAYRGLGRDEDEAIVRERLPSPPMVADCSRVHAALEDFDTSSLATIRTYVHGTTDCARLARSVVCRVAAVSHDPSVAAICARPEDQRDYEVRDAHYLAAYASWGRDWEDVVEHAVKAMPTPGAEQVAIAALTASLRASCEPAHLESVRRRAQHLLREPAHDARWTRTLHSLTTVTPQICDRL